MTRWSDQSLLIFTLLSFVTLSSFSYIYEQYAAVFIKRIIHTTLCPDALNNRDFAEDFDHSILNSLYKIGRKFCRCPQFWKLWKEGRTTISGATCVFQRKS